MKDIILSLFGKRSESARTQTPTGKQPDKRQNAEVATTAVGKAAEVIMVRIDALVSNPARSLIDDKLEGLAQSVRTHGLIVPIIVREAQEMPGKYEIIAGERRVRAARLAGLVEVVAVVKNVDTRTSKIIALTENLQRQELSEADKILAIGALLREIASVEQTAKVLAVPPKVVENYALLYKAISAHLALMSVLKRNAAKIDLKAARVLARIGRYADQSEISRFLKCVNDSGVLPAISRFRPKLPKVLIAKKKRKPAQRALKRTADKVRQNASSIEA